MHALLFLISSQQHLKLPDAILSREPRRIADSRIPFLRALSHPSRRRRTNVESKRRAPNDALGKRKREKGERESVTHQTRDPVTSERT